MKTIRIVVLCGALGAAGTAGAHDGNVGGNTARHAQGESVLLQQRDIYVPVDEHGRVTGNELIVVRKQSVIPAGKAGAWARTPPDATYALLPDPEDSAHAPAPRYHIVRLGPATP